MPLALSIAWRLLLAVALIVSPIVGLASDGACMHGGAATAQAAPVTQVAQAMPEAMPGCTHMADMAPKAPQGKPDPARHAAGHGACTSSACCLGGAVGITDAALAIADAPAQQPLAIPGDAPQHTAPSARLLRPPIA